MRKFLIRRIVFLMYRETSWPVCRSNFENTMPPTGIVSFNMRASNKFRVCTAQEKTHVSIFYIVPYYINSSFCEQTYATLCCVIQFSLRNINNLIRNKIIINAIGNIQSAIITFIPHNLMFNDSIIKVHRPYNQNIIKNSISRDSK